MREPGKHPGVAPQDRLAGAGPKPPEAALVKSQGGERFGQRADLKFCSGKISGDEEIEPSMRCRKPVQVRSKAMYVRVS